MSDDEDNQLLIDEIQALQNALDHKSVLSNNDHISTSDAIHNEEELSTNKRQISTIQNEDYSHMDYDEHSISVEYQNYECKDLQDLLELNKKLLEALQTAHQKMVCLLEECNNNKRKIQEQIVGQVYSWQCKIIHFNAGMPYFKDKNYFTAQRNEDTETKIKNGELRLTDLQRITRWSQTDKTNLLKAIRHEVTLSILNKNNSEECIDSITKTSHLPNDVKKAIGSLGTMKFDWLKVANDMPDNKHSAEECEVMWNVFLHPDINKHKWTSKEDRNLNQVVSDYGFEDWDSIAAKLGTNRSGYQCFIRYNTNNWKNLMKGQYWSPNDDATLCHLVSKLKIGDYIPWGYIASCMNNWTKQQVYFRWIYSLAPHLRKGRFSVEEHHTFLKAIEKYGPNFGKISALVMTSRTGIQLKEHYNTILNSQEKKVWNPEEDMKLIELHKQYGPNWVKIIKEIPHTNRTQARQRYSAIMRYQKKGVRFPNANDAVDPLSSRTVLAITSNTPWSRENKEIYVRHLKIDDQLINFFKKDNMLRKIEQLKKAYHPEQLRQDTKKLFHMLVKLNANLNLPDLISDELSEMNQELLMSLKNFMEEQRIYPREEVEIRRRKMFGPQEQIVRQARFIPPLPFGFCSPKNNNKKRKTDNIDLSISIEEFNQIQMTMILERNKDVTDCLDEDTETQFEKLKNIMTNTCKKAKPVYSLKCKRFANSVFFQGIPGSVNNDNIHRPRAVSQKINYDWELNKITSDSSSTQPIPSNSFLQTIEPNITILRAYQELLLHVGNSSINSSPTDSDDKVSLRGRKALYQFKCRYQQLFQMSTGLSRIILPDAVDESAFLPVIEKLKKKNIKKKHLARRSKTVNTDT